MKRQMAIYLPELHGEAFLVEREDHCNGYPVYSGILVCTRCFDIWARLTWEIPVPGIAQRTFESHEVRGLLCLACFRSSGGQSLHPDLSPVPGSLLHNLTVNNWDSALLEALPEALVQREFFLTMESLCNPESDLSLKRGRMLESALELPGSPISSSSLSSGSESGQESPSVSPSSSPEFLSLDPISSDAFLTD